MPTDPTPPAPAPLTEWRSCGHTAPSTCFECYVERGRRWAAEETAHEATRAELARERAELAEVNAFRAEPLKAIRNLIGEEDQDDEALLGSACTIILSWKGLAANKKKAEAERDAARTALQEAEKQRAFWQEADAKTRETLVVELKAHAETRAALERVEGEREEAAEKQAKGLDRENELRRIITARNEEIAHLRPLVSHADQAGRALVVALEALLAHLEYREPDGWMSGQVHADDADAARAALTAAPTRWRTGEGTE